MIGKGDYFFFCRVSVSIVRKCINLDGFVNKESKTSLEKTFLFKEKFK